MASKQAARWLLVRYGITPAQRQLLAEQQAWRCAICFEPFATREGHTGPHVDHDHASGKVRGLLCTGCNKGLGLFRDNPLILRQAWRYLEAQ